MSTPVADSIPSMNSGCAEGEWNERYSRQVILPGVGVEGQKKWGEATAFLAGEGFALEAAITALSTVGVHKLLVLSGEAFDPSFFTQRVSNLQIQVLPLSAEQIPSSSVSLIVTENEGLRRRLNRQLRCERRPALFAWPAGSGFAIFFGTHQGGRCPCVECLEVMNPKAFGKGTPSIQRILGATAASEALQLILKSKSPIENKVWITSLGEGVSIHHEVLPSYKCGAMLLEDGATAAS